MAEIITLTFNPCIDKNTTVNGVVPEKKMRCAKASYGPGGGGINVSRALKNLGKDSTAIFPSGGYSGKFLQQLMTTEGIPFRTIETSTHTRENFIVLDTSSNLQYRFGMPGNAIEEKEWKALLAELENTEANFIVASGSMLPGMSPDIVGQVAAIAKAKGAKLILDTSGEALEKALEIGVYLLKPNLGELSSLVGKEHLEQEEVDSLAREIILQGQCEVMVVSMGDNGAKLVTMQESYHVVPPDVPEVSTLGAGDSMVAGMVLALSQNKPLREVLQMGVACGTAATITHGSELCRKEDVESLFRQIVSAS
ncbi:MAG TPA: 1-phosphofructokinase family hexose kinase [Flavisolibacter sp.]|jgi:6-phosphofructokinase 2|nr:1-phosphofructokinase family hexose kinase [Flavisolibacter sp.]